MSNLPAPTEGLPIHGPFLNLSASDAQRRRYFLRCWSRLIGAEPCPVDTGRVHGPRRAPCPTCKGKCSVHLFGRADAPRVVCGSCGGSGQAGLITCG
jgi:hypothetical protein